LRLYSRWSCRTTTTRQVRFCCGLGQAANALQRWVYAVCNRWGDQANHQTHCWMNRLEDAQHAALNLVILHDCGCCQGVVCIRQTHGTLILCCYPSLDPAAPSSCSSQPPSHQQFRQLLSLLQPVLRRLCLRQPPQLCGGGAHTYAAHQASDVLWGQRCSSGCWAGGCSLSAAVARQTQPGKLRWELGQQRHTQTQARQHERHRAMAQPTDAAAMTYAAVVHVVGGMVVQKVDHKGLRSGSLPGNVRWWGQV
jgi:hypothetical protein